MSELSPTDQYRFNAESQAVLTVATDFLTGWYGPRCPEFEKDCICCRRWAALDRLVGVPRPRYHCREGAEQTPVAKTIVVSNSINVDLDIYGDVVGVEIL